jgi:hypothetical protein
MTIWQFNDRSREASVLRRTLAPRGRDLARGFDSIRFLPRGNEQAGKVSRDTFNALPIFTYAYAPMLDTTCYR